MDVTDGRRQVILAYDEVHIWCLALGLPADTLTALARTLSPDERARCDRYHFERDRRAYIAARGQLRAILARYLAVEPMRLRFGYGRHGKPALPGTALQFNLSHAHRLMLLAVTRERDVGVDLEQIRPLPDLAQLVERCFSPSEQTAFLALPAQQRLEGFYSGWTRKEAYLKATGEGLARPLDSFEVSLAPADPTPLLRAADGAQSADAWSLRSLPTLAGYVAAVCARGRDWRIVYADQGSRAQC